ncbi:glycoside hydrolase family 16 protein [Bipolaris maydis ATCC 48331]|uniref:Glycoside hydrolase family 16 protein n=2 Tax=Cochliobolus heterostrophus TaxID=5016 RepID=M2TD06_COCH5|nr:glycoside hydrolase family 16 protein [Bipolaris maydis ATCC 48331]EMD95355.1 glycoside hydrolase family 16 protein [Bipolaris maydis C5]KAJ5055131.1 concanavalin A-like lectin/glucanase domain-containing protein [Bipolaris maydis]ENI00502.1 glycoside hydrolase family 16 protein [Bipolaris maydis ATCC 48331]KAJ6191819.1 concanavalin A-like lectin/glucanase domain-containing protein [Bipolaris maydis]KAJ6203005.1 concanavalin A-like lectin/glucanase domain-containing protein [Bipolaris maydi
MFTTATLLLALAILNFLSKVAAEDCTVFSTNGSTAATYDFYRFYDFRNLDESLVGNADTVPDSGDKQSITVTSNGQSKIIAASPWGTGWDARYWLRPAAREDTIDMHYTPSSVSISKNNDGPKESSTYLTLHTIRLLNGTQLASELDFIEHNVTYASIRMSARIRGAGGAIAGFFTYHNDTAESDIEIPTGGTGNEIHYSNQPTADPDTEVPIEDATFNVSMKDHRPTSVWNNYRLDWIRGGSAWYVNGKQTAKTSVNVPDAESMIILNLWSNGGSFSGRMDTGNEAWFDIQWVELLFNTTATTAAKSSGTVCSVESSPGSPVPNTSCSLYEKASEHFWWVVGLVSIVTFVQSM